MEEDKMTNHDFLDETKEQPVPETEIEKYIIFEKLEKYVFSPGTITWKKNLILSAPGDLLDHEYLEKFKTVTNRLPCDFVLKPINISTFNEIFTDFKLAKKFKTKNGIRIKALKWFKSLYWEGEREAVLAELMEGAYEVFYKLPKELDHELKTINTDLFRVYSLKASLLVIFSVALGVVDFKYLQDLYHLPFFFNISLQEKLSYNHAEALKFEWEDKGEAIDYLKSHNVTKIEIDSFINNSKLSLRKYGEFYNSEKKNNDIFNVFKKSWERPLGSGYPKGLNSKELSDIENLVVFICSSFGTNDINPTKADYKIKLEKRILDNEKLPPRLKNIIEGVFLELGEAEEMLLGA